jgi:hypothetical protein
VGDATGAPAEAALPSCADSGGQHVNWDGTSFDCGTSVDFGSGTDLEADGAISDEAVAATELADAADGSLLTWDGTGEAALLAPGTSGQVLQANGAGALPSWEDAAGGSSAFADITSGTNTTAAMVVGSGSSLKKAGTGTIDASGIDADGDGTEELASSGTIVLDPDDDGVQDFIFTGGGASTDYIEFVETGSWGYVRAGPGNNGGLILQTKTGSAEVAFYPGAGNVLVFRVTASGVIALVPNISSPSTATCADSGDGSPGALTITPTTSYVRITNSDPHGCTLTLSETGAVDGQGVELELSSSAGGTVTLSDTAGAHDLAGDWTPGVGDSITLRYNATASEWRERTRADI